MKIERASVDSPEGPCASAHCDVSTRKGPLGMIVCYSEIDGVLLLFVDTGGRERSVGISEDENGPLLRIYLNDEPVYENPPFPKEKE